ncbi:hypothetical protein BDC45DRAFT_554542 [Circinella umbellata]|nr:hypothetical protein BDC45DRAFT_554542 [Circinella umbellata]
MPYIEVKWTGKQFHIEFKPEEFENATVHDLKQKCHQITHVDPERIKLLAYGAVMKNNEERLSSYGIRDGSKVILMATPAKAMDNVASKTVEGQLLEQISIVTEKLNQKIVPDIESYEKRVKEFLSQRAGGLQQVKSKEQKKLQDYGVYLNEQLMNILFDFDGILTGVDEKARHQRKEGVRQAQALLDKVDNIKSLVM